MTDEIIRRNRPRCSGCGAIGVRITTCPQTTREAHAALAGPKTEFKHSQAGSGASGVRYPQEWNDDSSQGSEITLKELDDTTPRTMVVDQETISVSEVENSVAGELNNTVGPLLERIAEAIERLTSHLGA